MTPELKHLQSLEPVSLITMPRAGSEFLQSLLDGHPEIIVFILNFKFFSEYLPSSKVISQIDGSINQNDFIYELVGKEISRFKGKYNLTERLDRLGASGKKSLEINLNELIKNFHSILNNEKPSIKNIFLALYGAYHKTIGRDIFTTKILFHHSHILKEDILFNKYFSGAKRICCIRDPRASIKSFVINCKNYSEYNYHYFSYYDALEVINNISNISKKIGIEKNSRQCLFVRLEDLPREDILKKIQKFLGISMSTNIFVSTWAGLEWRGDMISGKSFDSNEKWFKNRSYNNWKEHLSFVDKFILKNVFSSFLIKHNYEDKSCGCLIKSLNKLFALFLLIKPLSLEYEFFSIKYAIKKLKLKNNREFLLILSTPYFYLRSRAVLLKSILTL